MTLTSDAFHNSHIVSHFNRRDGGKVEVSLFLSASAKYFLFCIVMCSYVCFLSFVFFLLIADIHQRFIELRCPLFGSALCMAFVIGRGDGDRICVGDKIMIVMKLIEGRRKIGNII